MNASSVNTSELVCPVCYNLFQGRVYQCASGHLICGDCKPEVNHRCFTCGRALGSIRNRFVERMARNLERPCGFDKCSFKGNQENIEVHRKFCEYRPYVCPFECNWKGREKDLMEHLEDAHGTEKLAFQHGKDMVIRIANPLGFPKVEWSYSWSYRSFSSILDFLFTVKRDFSSNCFHFFIQGLSRDQGATTDISMLCDCQKPLIFTNYYLPICEKHEAVIASGKCLSVPVRNLEAMYEQGAAAGMVDLKVQVEFSDCFELQN